MNQDHARAGVSRRKLLAGTAAGIGATAVGLTLGTGSATASSLMNGLWANPAQGYFPNGGHYGAPRGSASHAGQDITGPTGTAIYAARGGTVQATGSNLITGRTGTGIILRHANNTYTYYGHLSRVRVSRGDRVETGNWIGDMGATGNVTGPHLHFEIHTGSLGSTTNPVPYMRNRGVDLGGGWLTLDPGASGSSVRVVQRLLNSRGGDLQVDGDFGSVTTQAVRSHQNGADLVVDGQVGPKTWPTLIRTVDSNSPVGHGVRSAQEALNRRGDGLRVDGDFGSVTRSAVETFQRVNQLVVDGECGPITWRADVLITHRRHWGLGPEHPGVRPAAFPCRPDPRSTRSALSSAGSARARPRTPRGRCPWGRRPWSRPRRRSRRAA
ncbi:hypothetical protein BJF85_10840 [Saccharomonospora sp. CUA-673]|uniref:peptidoglycan-binding protein n=1 Tax=Saccharomonospora sp. CUA-673 TaxID=1904969 RepID=UPI00095DFC78|nr:peptidoglycan-binding protein [Saccharomonospora sp. CUA-673]OLT48953.1 hypothetical protein BJF85_10840 [Saccharomonospora sp. CUA-673]